MIVSSRYSSILLRNRIIAERNFKLLLNDQTIKPYNFSVVWRAQERVEFAFQNAIRMSCRQARSCETAYSFYAFIIAVEVILYCGYIQNFAVCVRVKLVKLCCFCFILKSVYL
jgi:hypothetical protein